MKAKVTFTFLPANRGAEQASSECDLYADAAASRENLIRALKSMSEEMHPEDSLIKAEVTFNKYDAPGWLPIPAPPRRCAMYKIPDPRITFYDQDLNPKQAPA